MKSPRSRSQSGADLLRLQEEERRAIARELHSTTAQRLAAMQLNLSLVARSAEALDPRARAALTDSIDLVRTCAREIRSVSYRLHPPLIDEFGLPAALRAMAEELRHRTGAGIDLILPESATRLPDDIEMGVFRVAQDAVSAANLELPVELRLECERSRVVLELIFSLVSRSRDPRALRTIRERSRQLKGRLVIKSARKRITLRMTIPLARVDLRDASA